MENYKSYFFIKFYSIRKETGKPVTDGIKSMKKKEEQIQNTQTPPPPPR